MKGKFDELINEDLKDCVKKEFNLKKAIFGISFIVIYIPILVFAASPLAKDRDFSTFLLILVIMLPIVFALVGRLTAWRR